MHNWNRHAQFQVVDWQPRPQHCSIQYVSFHKSCTMAEVFGMPCVLHISGFRLGYLYTMHFVSAIANARPFHEFKGFIKDIPLHCAISKLDSENGIVTIASDPGAGIEIDPDFIAKHGSV